jgi:arabinogalactan endo-1,4-beta-galactosidase
VKAQTFLRLAWAGLLASLSCIGWSQTFFGGGDVSEIPQVEAAGGKFSYRGKVEDPFVIMRQAGWNLVRFRIWNDPKGGLCDKAYTLKLAKRAYAQGLKISLDFHYSDWWADPGKQYAPAKWKNYSLPQMEKAVYGYTKDVVGSMIRQGTPPYMVQVGNEIVSGMCWPQAKLDGNKPVPWEHLGRLLKAGIRAVHDAAGGRPIVTMLHLDRGGDNPVCHWWFDHILKEGVQFDAIGLSYYPFWHGTLAAAKANLNDLANVYGKDVYIVETAYPWASADDHQQGALNNGRAAPLAGFPVSPEGQRNFLQALKAIIEAVPGGHGKGFLYWAPTWISAPNSKTPYANLATFDYAGAALPSVDTLSGR